MKIFDQNFKQLSENVLTIIILVSIHSLKTGIKNETVKHYLTWYYFVTQLNLCFYFK